MASRKRGDKKLGLTEQLEYFYLDVEDKGAWLKCTHDECKRQYTNDNIKFYGSSIDLNILINNVLDHFEEYHKEHKELRRLLGKETAERLTANIKASDK